LIALKGWSAPEVGDALGRASELCRKVGSTDIFSVLCNLGGFHLVRGEIRKADELFREALAIAEQSGDSSLLIWAQGNAGIGLCEMGEFGSARSYLEQASSLYDPALRDSYRALSPVFDPGVWYLGWLAENLCFLGYVDQALQKSRRALALARESDHPFSIVNALSFSSFIHAMRRQGEETLRLANEYQRVATKHGFAQMAAWSLIHRGNGLIVLNQAEQGILEILKGIAASRATGSKASMPYAFAILGDGYRRAGDMTAGLEAIAEGLAVSEASGERLFDAELYRLRGELLLQLARGCV
jgi:tetratricopeptide (TPR) repeat protein